VGKSTQEHSSLRDTSLLNARNKVYNSTGPRSSPSSSHKRAQLSSFKKKQEIKRISNEEHELDLVDHQICLIQKEIVENATVKASNDSAPFVENPLKGHEVTKEYRTKMTDWMVEVCTSFKCTPRAYFLATMLFDKYMAASTSKTFKVLTNKDVHCLGITAMYLASKYEDIYPLHSKIVSDKIAHRAISDR